MRTVVVVVDSRKNWNEGLVCFDAGTVRCGFDLLKPNRTALYGFKPHYTALYRTVWWKKTNTKIRIAPHRTEPNRRVLQPPPSTRVLFTLSFINIVLNIIPTLYECYIIVSVHRIVMENRPVDPGSIQGRESPTYILAYILHDDKTWNTRGRYFF